MAEPQKKEPSRLEKFVAKAAERRAEQPSFGGEMRALGREARKDIANTLNQVFFDQPATMGEPGTPMVPTSQMTTEDLKNKEVDKSTDRIEPPKTPKKQKDRGLEMDMG